MKYQKIETKFGFDKDQIKLLHPLEWFKLIKDVSINLEQQIKELKKDCNSPFKWQIYKQQILGDWGQWSHKTNKILRIQIKQEKNKKLNKLYNYAYQYWWQCNFYLEIDSLFLELKTQKASKKLYSNNKKQLEKIIKDIQKKEK